MWVLADSTASHHCTRPRAPWFTDLDPPTANFEDPMKAMIVNAYGEDAVFEAAEVQKP